MNDRDKTRLEDMRRAARRARTFADGKTRADLEANNELLGFALVRAVELVGEAASKVTPETRQAHPDIPWRNIIGMRNRIVHDYLNVDYDIVWTVVTDNLPPLIKQLDAILISDNSS
jgi:uncharacterized protein with HEPN domain